MVMQQVEAFFAKKSLKFDLLVAAIVAIIAAIVRFKGIKYGSFDLDEAVHLWYAQMDLAKVIEQARNDPNPPFFNILISLWIKVFGVTEVAARCFSVFFSALASGSLYFFIKRNFDWKLALTASVLFLVSAVQLRFAHNARPYGMLMFFTITSYGLLFDGLKRPHWIKHLAYALSTCLMLYAHPTGVFNLPAQGLIILLAAWRDNPKKLLWSVPMVGAFAGFGLYFLLTPYYSGATAEWLSAPNWKDVRNALYLLLGIVEFERPGPLPFVLLGYFLVGGLLVMLSTGAHHRKAFLYGLLWMLVPMLTSIAYSYLITPIYTEKYTLTVHVGSVLLAAAALQAVPWAWLRGIMLVVLVGLSASTMNFLITSGEDWSGTVKQLQAEAGPKNCVLITPWYQFRSYAYYADNEGYKMPDSTYVRLVARKAFTTVNDVFDKESQRPLFNTCQLIVRDRNEAVAVASMELLKRVANRQDTLIKEGLMTITYHMDSLRYSPFRTFESDTNHVDVDGVAAIKVSKPLSTIVLLPMGEMLEGSAHLNVSATVKPIEGPHDLTLGCAIYRHGKLLQGDFLTAQTIIPIANGWLNMGAVLQMPGLIHPTDQYRFYVMDTGQPTVYWLSVIGVQPVR